MNVVLIQPPDPPRGFSEEYQLESESRHLSPDWDLLSLAAFLRRRTQFYPHYLDTRLLFDLRKDLIGAIQEIGAVDFAIVKANCLSLGPVAAVLDILKRYFPKIKTVICGEYPSQFPEKAAIMPRVDYALAGDPELIFQALCRHISFPQRLKMIKGLIVGQSGLTTEPQWLRNLAPLHLPTWDDLFVNAYRSGFRKHTLHFHMRISRGHSHTPSDRAAPAMNEPLRIWNLDRLAAFVKESAAHRVSQIIFTDPPGVWTQGRLEAWCQSLKRINNFQPWRFQTLPMDLDESQLDLLIASGCSEVNLVFPSCRPEVLSRYGCEIYRKDIFHIITELQRADIKTRAHFWLGGPEESSGEARRVLHMIRSLNYIPYALHPFPFHLDSFLYRESCMEQTPHIDEWVDWAANPWLIKQPAPFWRGEGAVSLINNDARCIHNRMKHSPRRWLYRFGKYIQNTLWYQQMEESVHGALARYRESHSTT